MRALLIFLSVLCAGLVCVIYVFPPPPPPPPRPVHRPGDKASTLQLLAGFSRDASSGILSGQNIGHANHDIAASYHESWEVLAVRGLDTPAVMAVDYGLDGFPGSFSTVNRILIQHARQGGLVSISMHPPNPCSGRDCYDKQLDFTALLTPGAAARVNWLATLNHVADGLEELAQHDVVVLWRPLHEMNGDWFWWSAGGTAPALKPAEYRLLWRDMHQHFTRTRKLHNLLWVYSVSAVGDHVPAISSCYPGEAHVDVVGLDYYGGDVLEIERSGAYREVQLFHKPLALSEFGAEPMNGTLDAGQWASNIRQHFPRFAYVVFWQSWPEHLVAIADMRDAVKIANHDDVIGLVELRTRRGDR